MKTKQGFYLTSLLVLSLLLVSCGGTAPTSEPPQQPTGEATRPSTTLPTQVSGASPTSRGTDTPQPSAQAATPQPATKAAAVQLTPSGPPALSDVTGYQQWLKFNPQPIVGRTHGLTDIYINQTRAKIAPGGSLTFPFPEGTLIVKEILSSNDIAIMRKVTGVDPAHNDWQWIEYRSNGSIIGKDQACWGCHSGAKSTDYVFTALESP